MSTIEPSKGPAQPVTPSSNPDKVPAVVAAVSNLASNLKPTDASSTTSLDRLLLLAVRQDEIDLLKIAFQRGANPNIANNDGITPLMNAVNKGLKDIVELLLQNGANPNIANKAGKTALMYAADKGCKDILELLLQRGANPNIANTNGSTALMYAAEKGHKDIVAYLLKMGADHLPPSLHQSLIESRIPLYVAYELNFPKILLQVLQLEAQGIKELYKLFTSRGIFLLDKKNQETNAKTVRPFLDALSKNTYSSLIYALVSNPAIPLTKDSLNQLEALLREWDEDKLTIAIQGGATLKEIKDLTNLTEEPKSTVELLNRSIVFRNKKAIPEAVEIVTKTLDNLEKNRPVDLEMTTKALRLLERVETTYHEEMEEYKEFSKFENSIGTLLLNFLEKKEKGLLNYLEKIVKGNDLEKKLVIQALATLSKMDAVHYNETNLPCLFETLEIIKKDTILLLETLKLIRNYSKFDQIRNHPEWVDTLLNLTSTVKDPFILQELTLLLASLPDVRALKHANKIINGPKWKERAYAISGPVKGDFSMIRHKPLEHDSNENILNRILDHLSLLLPNKEWEKEYSAYLKNKKEYPEIAQFEDKISSTPLRGLRYLEALYLPSCLIFRGINARKGKKLQDLALLDLLEKGASSADLENVSADSATFAKVGQFFTSLNSKYVFENYFSEGGALMTIKSDFVNRQILQRNVRCAAESNFLHYVFYQTIPLEAMEKIFIPKDLYNQIQELLKSKIEPNDEGLLRLHKALKAHGDKLIAKLVPYNSIDDVIEMLPKEATFQDVVDENVKRFIQRRLMERSLKAKM